MHFMNIRKLREDLIKGDINDNDAVWYLMIYSIIAGLDVFLKDNQLNNFDIGYDILSSIVIILGIYFSYICNKKDNGKNFLLRFILVSWVTSLRFIFITAIFYMPFEFIRDKNDTSLIDLVFYLSIDILLLYRIGHHITIISNSHS